jgi:hypothetical protein
VPTYGEKSRPRLLVQGYEENIRTALLEFVPTVELVNDLGEVRQDEWDALLTNKNLESVADHLYVVGVGSSSFGRCEAVTTSGARGAVPISWFGYSRATELEVPNELPLPLSRLVHEILLAVGTGEQQAAILRSCADWAPPGEELIQPFFQTTEPRVLAGKFLRAGGRAWCWALPRLEDPVPWVLIAIEEWSGVDSERFPSPPNWRHRPQWHTDAEGKLWTKLEDARNRHRELLAQAEHEIEVIEKELDMARWAADTGERRLLTEQGPELVNAVKDCLRSIGFDVTDMDEVTKAGDRREDLRVATSDKPGWTALVEVRGYKRGAQVNDLQRIGRFRRRYLQETGRDSDRVWYIVNQFLKDDPAGRSAVFQFNEPDFATFAEDDGLVIDTVQLFSISRAVQLQEIDSALARNSLINATGWFEVSALLGNTAFSP